PQGESTIYFIAHNLTGFNVPVRGFITIPPPLQVRRTNPICSLVSHDTYRCDFATIVARGTDAASFDVFVAGRGGPVMLTASVEPVGAFTDVDPSNDRVERAEPIYDVARFALAVDAPERLDENGSATIRYSVTNQSDFE